jgi:transglutaminase-like putative cysteine protease
MKFLKKAILSITILSLTTLIGTHIYASEADFVIDTDTEISYTTGDRHVTVTTEYTRSVKNSSYYFPASGEKIFHIPDLSGLKEEEIYEERKYKLDTLVVTDEKGGRVNYSIEEKEVGEGIFVTIPNYKTTTPTAPYKVVFSFQTHDYVAKVGDFVNIIGTSLPTDTVFDRKEENNNTLTVFNYYLSIVVDSNISPLVRVFPEFTLQEKDGKTYYEFKQTDRIGNSPSVEFGTSVLYRFELEYKTPKTDSFIPEKYSEVFKALSTNIYELSLPREFSETNQKVYFENVSPLPKDIYRDSEGNILALFEVPANQESTITMTGYILVNQDELRENGEYFDVEFSQYLEKIKESEYIKRYLGSTKYWEVTDDLIRSEANKLKKDKITLLEIIRSNYQYINEKLEYDQQKATSENERIGAKAALLGGPSVCMEYADLMISLLRAQGIPSRAAIGYANLRETPPSEQVRHQWVQVWVPEYGWLSVDPTFESNNMKIGQMVDRVLWEVFNTDSLSNIRIYSANDIRSLTSEGYSVKIYGATDEVDLNTLQSYADLISKDEISENASPGIGILGNTMLKTTTLGKALIITVPILIVLAFLILLISLLSYLIRRSKLKRRKSKLPEIV